LKLGSTNFGGHNFKNNDKINNGCFWKNIEFLLHYVLRMDPGKSLTITTLASGFKKSSQTTFQVFTLHLENDKKHNWKWTQGKITGTDNFLISLTYYSMP